MALLSTCSALAREFAPPLAGTAPQSRGWLLVAYPGPWPHKPWQDNPLDADAGKQIADRATGEQIKPWFIRRHGSAYDRDAGTFEWAVVDALMREIQWHPAATLGEIATATWLSETANAEPHADAENSRRSTIPPPVNRNDLLYLVCTHGRRDQCCATLGRPVAAATERLRPAQTWECSHVGGHRLAGNLVVLPYGLYYGFVDPEDVPEIVAATDRGQVHVPLLRGAASDSPPVQAAKSAVYRATGNLAINALHATTVERGSDAQWVVQIQDASGFLWRAKVSRIDGPLAPESCGGDCVPSVRWVAELL